MSRTRHAPRPGRPKPKANRYKGTKTLFRELSDCRIYIVDGTAMRREVDDDFIMGSNAKDFPFLADDWPVSPDLPSFFPKR